MENGSVEITLLYAGLNALIMLALAVNVVRGRQRAQAGIGTGGDAALERAIRAHGNNIEYVPIALILMGLLEIYGQPGIRIHALGALLTLGRLLHAVGLSRSSGATKARVFGMVLTWTAIGVGALMAILIPRLG